MTAAPIHVSGERLLLDPAGALVWPARETLVVSDLHLEKGSFFAARRGSLLPPWDTRETLDRLTPLLRRWRPRTVVALGDSFHDDAGAGRLLPADAARLAALARELAFVWVLGNHDPTPRTELPGVWADEHALGPLIFRHQARPGAEPGEICGHHHPKATIAARGCNISRPCFVADARRVMLPAFGAYAGGLDIADPVIRGLFPRGGRAFLLGSERLFSFSLGGGTAARAGGGSQDGLRAHIRGQSEGCGEQRDQKRPIGTPARPGNPLVPPGFETA